MERKPWPTDINKVFESQYRIFVSDKLQYRNSRILFTQFKVVTVYVVCQFYQSPKHNSKLSKLFIIFIFSEHQFHFMLL